MSQSHEYQQRILFHLEKVNAVSVTDDFMKLQQWQAQRLLETHWNLYQQPRFKPAIVFFKDELYSAVHFKERNSQLIKALPLMCTSLPTSVLAVVEKAAYLHYLSLELDALLLHQLGRAPDLNDLDMATWIKAYQQSDNQTDRIRQIDLIESIGFSLAKLVKKPLLEPLLAWARIPASVAGYGEVHAFVSGGFHAFKAMKHPPDFLNSVIETERSLSSQWFNQASASS